MRVLASRQAVKKNSEITQPPMIWSCMLVVLLDTLKQKLANDALEFQLQRPQLSGAAWQ